jgi:hypothetical protein
MSSSRTSPEGITVVNGEDADVDNSFDVNSAALHNVSILHVTPTATLSSAGIRKLQSETSVTSVASQRTQKSLIHADSLPDSHSDLALTKLKVQSTESHSSDIHSRPKFGRRLSMTTEVATMRFSKSEWQEFGVDCWGEGSFSVQLFLLTSVFEIIPPYVD